MSFKSIFFVADASSIHTVKWVDYFVLQGYDVYLATFSQENNTKCSKVFFLSDKKMKKSGNNFYYLFQIFKLSKILQEIKPDIINAHFSYSLGFITLLALKMSKVQSLFSVVCHGSDILSPPMSIITNKINRYVLDSADKIFAVSDQLKDAIEFMDIDIDKIFIGQYGIDIKAYHHTEKEIDIISNRAYIPNSRIDLLLDILNKEKYDNLNIVFVLPNITTNTLHYLQSKYNNIDFYSNMDYEVMIKMIKKSKIYVSATKSDGTALSLLEAMYFKCIPLVSNIVSNRSWILDSVNGYLFNSKKDLEIKLDKILNEEKQNLITKINKKLITEKANYMIQMKKIENFLIG